MIPRSLLSFLYGTGVALTAFSAIYWPEFLGPLGASPGFILITACVFLSLLVRFRRSLITKKMRIAQVLSFGVLGSFISLALFGWSTIYATKFVSLALLTLIWMSPLMMQDVLLMRHLRTAAIVGIVICLAGYLLSDLLQVLPHALRDMLFRGEFANYENSRARGFTEEPGHFATLLGRFLFIAYLIWESGRAYSAFRLVAMLCLAAATLMVMGSKGAVAGIAVAILVIGARRQQLPYFVLLLPLLAWTASVQITNITVDIEQFTSTATRLTLSVAAISAVVLNPFGYGFYGFYGAIQLFGSRAVDWLSDYPLVFNEVREIVDDLVNVSSKSTLLDFTLVLGWPFLFMLRRAVMLIDIRDPRAQAGLIYFFLTAMSTSANLSITFFLGLVVLMKAYPVPDQSIPRPQLRPIAIT
jgi:hypothetical protein